MRKAFLLVLAAVAAAATVLTAGPVTLYRVDLRPGTDAHRFAADNSLPAYYIGASTLLVGLKPDPLRFEAITSVSSVYNGDTRDLRWVHHRRGGQGPSPAVTDLFSADGIQLAGAGSILPGDAKSSGAYMVKPFNPRPIIVAPAAVIPNGQLTRDTAVAALVHLVDTALVRARIEALQSFHTRFLNAANHDSVVGWIRNQFLAMGITDVRLDTFNIGFGAQQHNIIATIPGLLDTSVVYIVGGHYDTYSSDLYNQAPGADDNASGTVAALEMARVLSQPGNRPNATVRFIAFDAEEYGLYGSEYYAQGALNSGMNIGCMLNYDMIGYRGNDSVFVSKLNPGSEGYAAMLGRMAGWYGRTADTNLVPEYNNVYLSGSDSWEFSIRGFPVTYSEELNFSTVYHQTNDSTTYMSMRYCTSIIKAGMGMLGTLANYPRRVAGLAVADLGDGARLQASWQPPAAANVSGYRLYWGRSSGVYTDTTTVAGTTDTIVGLMTDTLYYVGVSAIDGGGKESPFISETSGTPRLAPQAPAQVTAMPLTNSIKVYWRANRELDLAGYGLWRRVNAGSLDSFAYTADTAFIDQSLSGADKYYYTVRAYDHDGNTSALSAEAYGRPITLDQGILVVDETFNWTTGSFPRDTTQDQYWDTLLAGYRHEQYEFGNASLAPVLSDFGPYSTVVWHGDDYSNLLASPCTTSLRNYLDHGGQLLLVGWKPTADLAGNTADNLSFGAGSFMYDRMKVSGMTRSAINDTFVGAVGQNGYPAIEVDSAKVPLGAWKGTMRYIEALMPVPPAEAIYAIDMRNDGSPFEGSTCGIRYLGSDYKLAYLGYPLYFMKQAQARALVVKVMGDFGETGVEGKPETRTVNPEYHLGPSVPNPFTALTAIRYQLPAAGKVDLSVYNVAGQKVRTLVNGSMPAGAHTVRWDGKDQNGARAAAGVYLVRLEAGSFSDVRKSVLLR